MASFRRRDRRCRRNRRKRQPGTPLPPTPVNKALRGGRYLYIDASDGSGGQFLTSQRLYGRSGCRGGSRSRKTAAGLISTSRKQTLTALRLSFVEGPSNNEKDKKKSFNLIYETPREVNFLMTFGHLLLAYYEARICPDWPR